MSKNSKIQSCHLLLKLICIIYSSITCVNVTFFNSVHILQLDITNKKDIENVVSFINNRVGSEGKL